MHKKGLKFAPVLQLAKLNFTYITTKITKARPGFDDRPEYPSVQINSSSPCIVVADVYRITRSTTSTFRKEIIKFRKYAALSFIFRVKVVSALEMCIGLFCASKKKL